APPRAGAGNPAEATSAPCAPLMIARTTRPAPSPTTTSQAPASPPPHEDDEWNAVTFDEWFLGKRDRRSGAGRRAPPGPAHSGTAVYVGTTGGGGLFVPINEEGRAGTLLSFDPETGVTALRRPLQDAGEADGEALSESMMVVLPEEPDGDFPSMGGRHLGD